MGAMPNEPSMEEILSSIKRIIAEEDGAGPPPRPARKSTPVAVETGADARGDAPADDQILELTDALPGESEAPRAQEEPAMTPPAAKPESKPESKRVAAEPARSETPKSEPKPARPRTAAPAPEPEASPETPVAVMSDDSAQAARDSLVNLSKLLVRPEDGQSNTLEGLVREMLRPMLKDWLDTHLPHLVEGMVKREIDRITGRV
jgi:cell pole-organizing protein PopZ